MAYYFIEVTDTFGGEANYSWVRKYCIEATESNVVRRAKAEIGWNGVRCDRADLGEIIELRPRGECVVAFIEEANPDHTETP
jgi:hypothetical protein